MIRRPLVLAAALFGCAGPAAAAGTAFTYQGLLQDSGTPSATYDFEVYLFDQPGAGAPLAGPFVFDDRTLQDGRFLLTIDPGPALFTGPDRWLELRVRRGLETGGYTQLLPRQQVFASPYAQHAADADFAAAVAGNSVSGVQVVDGGIGSADIDASMQRRVALPCPAGSAIRAIGADGAVTCEQALQGPAGTPGSADAWSRTGNAGTNPASNFLGTTDATAFEVRTHNARHLRIEPSAETAGGVPIGVNLIGGHPTNLAGAGVRGATIAGGGTTLDPVFDGPNANLVHDHYGVVGGGIANQAGQANGDLVGQSLATVGGGRLNSARGGFSVVGGGLNNAAGGAGSFIGGGVDNLAPGAQAAVAGGSVNRANGVNSAVGGGQDNVADANYSVVAGGLSNDATGLRSAIGGGENNYTEGEFSTVAGGISNRAYGYASAVGGGFSNYAVEAQSVVAGGAANSAYANSATVPGGTNNCAGASGSFAAGSRAKVRPPVDIGIGGACGSLASYAGGNGDQGTFVWADLTPADFLSTGVNRFEVRAVGGARFVSGVNAMTGAPSTGVSLDAGGGAWNTLSDRHAKAGIAPVDPVDVLSRVLALPVYTWHYQAQDAAVRHMGPMAQDFHAAFGLNGVDDRQISTIDPDGVALAAIQGMYRHFDALHAADAARIATLESDRAALHADNAALRNEMRALAQRLRALEAAPRTRP